MGQRRDVEDVTLILTSLYLFMPRTSIEVHSSRTENSITSESTPLTTSIWKSSSAVPVPVHIVFLVSAMSLIISISPSAPWISALYTGV